jgi:peptidoglycan hydrolase-like protein with peptidoglycan-binding domain
MDVKLPLLRRGDRGLQVSMLQTLLNLKTEAETDLATDGIFGPRTEAEVRAWQESQQLAIDGIVGDQTWTSILEFEGDPGIMRNI